MEKYFNGDYEEHFFVKNLETIQGDERDVILVSVGYGFDSDWNSTNSLFQYNLIFNNDGGFLLLCNSGGWPRDWSYGNEGTIVHYNISINDGLRNFKLKEHYFSPVIHCTGPIKNTIIEKNIFYLFRKPDEKIDRTLISLTDWSGSPDSTLFRENYIYTEEMYRAAVTGYLNATDLADYLAAKGMPFREAHHVAGAAVAYAIQRQKELTDLDLTELQKFSLLISVDIFESLTPKKMIDRRTSLGGTATENVKQAIAAAYLQLEEQRLESDK